MPFDGTRTTARSLPVRPLPIGWPRSRLRLPLHRSPRRLAYRVGIAAVAGAVGVTVCTIVATANARVDAIGPTRRVAVATRDIITGEVLNAGDIDWRDLPTGQLAVGAVIEGSAPLAGATVREPIARNEPFLRARLAPDGVPGVAGRLPPGHHGLAVPIDARTPPLAAGQRVDLYGPPAVRGTVGEPFDSTGAQSGAAEPPLTTGAIVVEISDDRATLAIRDADVARVAQALVDGAVVLAISGA